MKVGKTNTVKNYIIEMVYFEIIDDIYCARIKILRFV